MRDILDDALRWLSGGAPVAIATVVGIRGSAPRGLGAAMVVSADGQVRGNVSGGCVETAVVTACLDVIETGVPRVDGYGIAEDDLFAVGLMCGGSIDVLVRPVHPGSPEARDLAVLAAGEAVAHVLCVRGEGVGAARAIRHAESGIHRDAAAIAAADAGGDRPRLMGYDADGCRAETGTAIAVEYLVVPFAGPPRLVVVGAVQQAVALARLGAATGWAVTVLDPRDAFAAPGRFPGAEVVVDWPDRWLESAALDGRSAVCVLSHDERIDAPALRVALRGPAGYVGAMGSRRTHDERVARLRVAGVTEEQLERLRSPIGLDLGGRSPEETALSILAEIVAVRHGASGRPLSELHGPIHADAPT
ncbi:MAG: XdhC family protein [Microbacterium sp.]|uniref:XdhC family protein n=1 Tax=Microbacterium sp. TaxID=51671 RepID=UPI001AC67062|nr:XdhC family protein [Microbacterium sp.]MBN9176759.1 XdhC family protein [Microbacterium sp.]